MSKGSDSKTVTSESKRDSKLQRVAVLIAALSLLVAFTGVNLGVILSFFQSVLFPKADYIIASYTTPIDLKPDFRQSLSVSPTYYVSTSINLKTTQPYQGESLTFTIYFENKGKQSVTRPRIVIYFVDFIDRVWGMWNETSVGNVFEKKYNFEYRFPPLDQKITGTWYIVVLLYDVDTLVSYQMKQFYVTDVQRPTTLFIISAIAVSTIAMILTFELKELELKVKELRKRVKQLRSSD